MPTYLSVILPSRPVHRIMALEFAQTRRENGGAPGRRNRQSPSRPPGLPHRSATRRTVDKNRNKATPTGSHTKIGGEGRSSAAHQVGVLLIRLGAAHDAALTRRVTQPFHDPVGFSPSQGQKPYRITI
jgi:hypothetical protein